MMASDPYGFGRTWGRLFEATAHLHYTRSWTGGTSDAYRTYADALEPGGMGLSRFSPFLRYNGLVSLKLYLVTCDLLEAGDYESFKSRLRTFEARQVLGNQWALHSTHTAAQLKEILRQFLNERDRIVVTEVGAERASRRALCNLAEL